MTHLAALECGFANRLANRQRVSHLEQQQRLTASESTTITGSGQWHSFVCLVVVVVVARSHDTFAQTKNVIIAGSSLGRPLLLSSHHADCVSAGLERHNNKTFIIAGLWLELLGPQQRGEAPLKFGSKVGTIQESGSILLAVGRLVAQPKEDTQNTIIAKPPTVMTTTTADIDCVSLSPRWLLHVRPADQPIKVSRNRTNKSRRQSTVDSGQSPAVSCQMNERCST